ncbi:MAG: tRNA lysidine(34) synthetase TilS, partial [Syntrophus sp. (in: bacteria)]|nr:tRNA lysidine(34) synthetase TilS [Syntrophus sp. (in: bacteria)]
MSVELHKKVKQAIERHRMLDIGDGVIAAVSGGPDSVALLSVLRHLSAEYSLKLVVAHLNHGLRPGHADEEEALVHRLSERLELVCESSMIDIAALSRLRKTSVEETAREERYRFLESIRVQYNARKIALGHHAGDQAETVLMNLLRGSGPEGLKGMRPVREDVFI